MYAKFCDTPTDPEYLKLDDDDKLILDNKKIQESRGRTAVSSNCDRTRRLGGYKHP